MWMPRDPDVLGQPTRPKSASVARTTPATSRTCAQVDARHRIEVDAQLVRDDPGPRRGPGAGAARGRPGWPSRPAWPRRAARPRARCARTETTARRPPPTAGATRARASGRTTRRRCRWESAAACSAGRRPRAARRRRRRCSSGRGRAWCGRPRGRGPSAGSTPPRRVPRRARPRVRPAPPPSHSLARAPEAAGARRRGFCTDHVHDPPGPAGRSSLPRSRPWRAAATTDRRRARRYPVRWRWSNRFRSTGLARDTLTLPNSENSVKFAVIGDSGRGNEAQKRRGRPDGALPRPLHVSVHADGRRQHLRGSGRRPRTTG